MNPDKFNHKIRNKVMERKKLLKLAQELLKEFSSYVGRKYKEGERRYDGVKFNMKRTDDRLYVFNADKEEATFYWCDDCVDVARGLGLSFYQSYDRDIHQIVFNIY